MSDLAERLDDIAAYVAARSGAEHESVVERLLEAVHSVFASPQREEAAPAIAPIRPPAAEVNAVAAEPQSESASAVAGGSSSDEADYAPMYYI